MAFFDDLGAKLSKTGQKTMQKANDLAAQCDRFEKKLHDLKLTRQVSMQMAPQIRLLQNNDSLLVERIQSTLSNTLPLWKSQMVLALGLHHSQQALKAQQAVTDMTNELLRKNAETLKMGTIETAKEAERGIVDIETLVQTNQSLIDTINEVRRLGSIQAFVDSGEVTGLRINTNRFYLRFRYGTLLRHNGIQVQ